MSAPITARTAKGDLERKRVEEEEEDESTDLEDLRGPRMFKDPVWDLISFDPLTCQIIDTPQFQRLRFLKQLGTSYYVFPGASHNRFEHCLGTAHLARNLILHLKERQPRLKVTDRDVQCVTIAGLCHDLGHGPFSHVFDGHFIPAVRGPRADGTWWCHEEASEMMLDDLVKSNNIPLCDDDLNFVKDLIRGEPRLSKQNEKTWMFDIVANKKNGIDVDKWDYIARDTRAVGETCTLVASRLIAAARVVDGTITYNHKEANTVGELFYSRYSLHKRIYNHKTAKAIEHMIVEALIAADPVYKISAAIDDPKRYLYITDSIIEDVERNPDPRLEKAQSIIKDIRARKIPKRVEEKCLAWQYKKLWEDKLTPMSVAAMSVRLFEDQQRAAGSSASLKTVVEEEEMRDKTMADVFVTTSGLQPPIVLDENPQSSQQTEVEEVVPIYTAPLTEEDIIIDFSTIHFGMKDKDPLQLVKFYGVEDPDAVGNIRKDQSGLLRPDAFQECILRCFARDGRKRHQVQHAYRKVLETLPIYYEEPPAVDVILSVEDPPSTPPRELPRTAGHSRSGSGVSLPTASPGSVAPTRAMSSTPFATQPNNFNTIRPNPSRKRRRASGEEENVELLDVLDGSPARRKAKK